MSEAKQHKGKNPAFQFYPADWLRDPALRSVTSGARGLWIDMLCLMWDCVPRGYLQNMAGKPFSAEMICRMTGNISKDEVDRWLAELEDSGVLSRSNTGVYYSRRMVRDEHKRVLCQEAGRKGGNPTLKGGSKGVVNGTHKGASNRKPTPSSSASTSVDNKYKNAGEEQVEIEEPFHAPRAFCVNPQVTAILIGKSMIEYHEDPIQWEAEFVRRWNLLPGVSKRTAMALDGPLRTKLENRLMDASWDWKQAFMRFPIRMGITFTPTLTWFLKPETVSAILDDAYKVVERIALKTAVSTVAEYSDFSEEELADGVR